MNPLERYAPLVDDEEAFFDACERPLPSVVRVNTIKTTPARAREALDEEGVGYEPAGWHDEILKLDGRSPGTTWPYFHGWLHGQEEVSALPALAVDPEPGEFVWDACAAPGSKTTQLAALMDDTGLLVGNDNNLGRLSALRHNAERLGVTNLAVTNQDARNFSLKPFGSGQFGGYGYDGDDGDSDDDSDDAPDDAAREAFDRALVDAPCSCEGTVRKNPDVLDQWTMDHVHSVAGIQKGILRRAIQATKPGGTVVYSTCTFAPEENEAVLSHALEEEACRMVEFDSPLETVPGVTEWEDEEYHPDVTKAHRVYPHHNDTGGFFCAKLEVEA
ncbi:RsmB/NOP family class I SAM-dependent RNA methyltransferase [Haloprofundus sp. MHR1]|uniref:RsmB/NOP family class I SAM-dependent RNA methyltransferase n=1 Tax=Haloprofundus sp. MHR1 TaxID=2572921 RepID=UPI0010BE5ADE|nr:RsmB/NOP family class I SAM-dependent RNA methyltransferase [Haloprofundus sp. MHR1]QCJ48341.1 RsmB/NOP family class I SAM-dependent RNA methyltransferase [Haloprofundus sp. MHR1]